jgi:hypothetical protein
VHQVQLFLSSLTNIPYSKLIFDIISPNTRFIIQNRLLALREFYLQGFFKLIFTGEKVQTNFTVVFFNYHFSSIPVFASNVQAQAAAQKKPKVA